MEKSQIENIFTYHAPKGDQGNRYEDLRTTARALALLINDSCPESRENE